MILQKSPIIETPSQWYQYYHNLYIEDPITYDGNKQATIFYYRTNIQKVLTRTWVRRVFGYDVSVNVGSGSKETFNVFKNENIEVLKNEKSKEMYYFAIADILQDTLAYGEIVVDIVEGAAFLVYNFKKDVVEGEVISISYMIDKKGYYHYKEGEKWRLKIEDTLTGITETTDYSEDYPRCFLSRSIDRTKKFAQPIYADAYGNIESFEHTHKEMFADMELSKKFVFFPKIMEESTRKKMEKNKEQIKQFSYMDTTSRLFRTVNVDESQASMKPIYSSGEFNPAPFIETLDFYTSMINLHSGFGLDFITFQSKTGGLKTAEEVISDNVDFAITEKNIQAVVNEIIKEILKRFNYDISQVEITYTDIKSEDAKTKDARLLSELAVGALSVYGYHKERGRSDEEIKEIVPQGADLMGIIGNGNDQDSDS